MSGFYFLNLRIKILNFLDFFNILIGPYYYYLLFVSFEKMFKVNKQTKMLEMLIFKQQKSIVSSKNQAYPIYRKIHHL